jgi:hypothetical protein
MRPDLHKKILLLLGVCALLLGANASPAPAGEIGDPVVYIRLADPTQFPDLLKAGPNGVYLAGFKGVAIMERTSPYPILVTQGYNQDKKQFVRVYLSWSQVVGMQILDPKVAL